MRNPSGLRCFLRMAVKRFPQLARIGCVLAVFVNLGAVATEEPRSGASRFAQLAESFRSADLSDRRRFAEIALHELVAANLAEIHRAGAQQSVTPNSRWQAGAAAYVATLERSLALVSDAQEIEIAIEPYGEVRLQIGATQVMLNSPRLSQQRAFESAILGATCAVIVCPEVVTSPAATVTAESRAVQREWSFSDQSPPLLSASDGLHCVFTDPRHLYLKGSACDGLMQELRSIADGLRAVTEHGGGIDWTALRIVRVDRGRAQRVVYDRGGAYFDLDLPRLQGEEAVWHGAIPWLQSRLRGYAANYFIKFPERMAYSQP
ncbi:MAG: hypothetical protein ACREXT_18120 [Gammaproteobacteria bacterium]